MDESAKPNRTKRSSAKLRKQAWDLRCQGNSFRTIAKELHVSIETAHRLIDRKEEEVERTLSKDIRQYKLQQLEQLQLLQEKSSQEFFVELDPKMLAQVLAVMDRQAKLLRFDDTPIVLDVTACKPDYSRYRSDPVAFARDVLGIELWQKQEDILNALVEHRRVLAKSANSIGKTVVAAVAALWFTACYTGVGLVTSPKFDQIADVTFKEIRKYYPLVKTLGPKQIAPKAPEISITPEHFLYGRTASDPTAYQGHHSDEMLVVFEEATAISAPFWEAASGMLAGGTNTFWLAILNPTDPSSAAYAEEQSGRWHVIDISALEHPNIAAELKGEPAPYPSAVRLDQLRTNLAQWATVVTDHAARQPIDFEWDGKLWRPKPEAEARILGRYPSQASASIFSSNSFDLAYKRPPNFIDEDVIEIGCDVARFGDDLTSLHVRRGNTSLEHVTYHGQDTAWTAAKIKFLCDKWAGHFSTEEQVIDPKKIACKIDDAGVGGGVVDQADNYDFIGVNSGSAALDEDYPNVRSELLFTLAERLDSISLSNLDHDTVVELKRQAAGITYKLDPRGRRVAASKDEIKKRIKRSPDDVDAVSLAFYTPMNKLESF